MPETVSASRTVSVLSASAAAGNAGSTLDIAFVNVELVVAGSCHLWPGLWHAKTDSERGTPQQHRDL